MIHHRSAGLLTAAAIVLTACGGGDATTTTTAPPATTTSTIAASSTTTTPADLGDAIGELYVAAYADVVALLGDRPTPETALAGLGELKEDYIGRLVALGREREALAEADRAAVDARISAAVRQVPADTFAAYQDALDAYRDDPEVTSLITSFNVIGQYANFDLLRAQEPEEAARLGLE
jgi:hypothetical protein